jgi:hypothetical protein
MTNPQSKPINQKRGPQAGNAGSMAKRNAFMDAKSTSGSEKAALANMVTSALEMRGRGQAGKTNPALEGLHERTGPKTNPTADGSRLSSKYKRPITKG